MRNLALALIITGICLSATNAWAIIGIDTYTVLMLHFNGPDGSVNFADDSFSNHTVTAYGNAQIDTAQSKFGNGSGLFDGSGDYLSVPDSDDWYFAAGDFTIDFWVRFSSLSLNQIILMQKNDFDNYMIIYCSTANEILFRNMTAGPCTTETSTAWNPSINTWYHLALIRNGNDWGWYQNGAQTPTVVKGGTTIIENYAYPLYIGYSDAPMGGYLNGWLDELRISKGIARWTTDFIPPTSEYTAGPAEVIPEPATLFLLGFGFLGTLFKRKIRP